MRRTIPFLALAVAATALIGCDDSNDVLVVAPVPVDTVNAIVFAQDQCDIASFNAAAGAGTCTKQGNPATTFDQFIAELTANKTVAGWQFTPSIFTIRVGQGINVTNQGGEVHTYTHVVNFGGGVVPQLNTLSGNTVVAPECTALSAADNIAPGATFHVPAAGATGTANYQCCIHPWMRSTVTITN